MQRQDELLNAGISGRTTRAKGLALGFFLFVAGIVISYYFLDTKIARFFDGIIRSNAQLEEYVSDAPDMLDGIVIGLTAFSWIIQLYLKRKDNHNICARFFQLIGVTVPACYILKNILKEMFGRTNTKIWLDYTVYHGFHWLDGGGSFNGFPSGHMAVFTPIILALWRFYPRYRAFYLVCLAFLGFLLIATDYHFLSDVIAGTFLGWLVDISTNRILLLFLGDSGCETTLTPSK